MPRRTAGRGTGARWLKWALGGSFFFFVASVAAVLGFLGWLKSYLHGEEFRELVSRAASQFFKADGSFEPMHWSGSSVYSDGYAARGYADAPFSRITVNGIRAELDFGALGRGIWKVDGIGLNRVVLLINVADRLAGNAADAGAGAAGGASSHLVALLPRSVEVDEVSIVDANLAAEREEGGRISLSNVDARLRPVAGSEAWAVSGTGGKLAMPGFPELAVDTFTTRLKGDELFITDSAFTLLNGARLSAAGEMGLGRDEQVDLQLKIADLDLDEVVGPQWRDKLSGIVHGDADVERIASGGLQKAGAIEVTKGVVEDLEVLDVVADYAKAERFRRLVLHEARADFRHSGDRLEITNLVLQSDGLTRVTGDLVIEGGRIDGNFQVGVTPGTLKWIPGAEQKVFVEPKDGMLWTHLRVEGPVDNPSEDLSARLKSAAVRALVEGAVNDVLGVAPEGALEAGKSAVGAGVDAGKGAVDAAAEGGRKLLNTLTPLFKLSP